jgi:hypothetical protein
MWDHEILYADRYSKDEQLLVRIFVKTKNQNTNMVKNIAVMLGHAESRCGELCNSVQCHIFVNCLTCYN